MDHICVSPLQFMSHSHTQTQFSLSKLGNSVSFDSMNMRNRRGPINTLVGTQSFMSKEELPIRQMKYSQLVGGFVGSKSQLGTSNRISCQIWDIVFCKLMSFMSASNLKSSSLEHSKYSYSFVQDLASDMFDSMYRDISKHNTHLTGTCAATAAVQVPNNFTPVNSEKHNMPIPSAELNSNTISKPQQEVQCVKPFKNCKQSYADVTKTMKHTDMMKSNVKHEDIPCSKEIVKNKVQMIPVRKINNFSKRKKQHCRKRKANKAEYSANKSQNNHKKGSKFHESDQRSMTNLKLQNGAKSENYKTVSHMKKNIPAKAERDQNVTVINGTRRHFSDCVNTSLTFKLKQNCSTSSMPNNIKREVEFVAHEGTRTYPCTTVIPNDTLPNCNKNGTEFQSNAIKGEDVILPKTPFSHGVHEITALKTRCRSDSSDSDDFIVFAISEIDVLSESDSEEVNSDCENDCDIGNTWDTEEDSDELDNQVTSDIKKINEKWERMYSCVPDEPKEPKKVRFASNKTMKTVHSIIAWDFAYRAARIGPWEQIARDQERFMQRILKLEQIISPVLTVEHRLYVRQRTMEYLSVDDCEG